MNVRESFHEKEGGEESFRVKDEKPIQGTARGLNISFQMELECLHRRFLNQSSLGDRGLWDP